VKAAPVPEWKPEDEEDEMRAAEAGAAGTAKVGAGAGAAGGAEAGLAGAAKEGAEGGAAEGAETAEQAAAEQAAAEEGEKEEEVPRHDDIFSFGERIPADEVRPFSVFDPLFLGSVNPLSLPVINHLAVSHLPFHATFPSFFILNRILARFSSFTLSILLALFHTYIHRPNGCGWSCAITYQLPTLLFTPACFLSSFQSPLLLHNSI
jgi:hypothetical protein